MSWLEDLGTLWFVLSSSMHFASMNIKCNFCVCRSAAMEQHRLTCSEEGRYVGKCASNKNSAYLLLFWAIFDHFWVFFGNWESLYSHLKISRIQPDAPFESMIYVVFRGRNGIESHLRTERARIQHEVSATGLYTSITLGRDLASAYKTVLRV